jgi:hypothetical protein
MVAGPSTRMDQSLGAMKSIAEYVGLPGIGGEFLGAGALAALMDSGADAAAQPSLRNLAQPFLPIAWGIDPGAGTGDAPRIESIPR